jgi:hypothetical protein
MSSHHLNVIGHFDIVDEIGLTVQNEASLLCDPLKITWDPSSLDAAQSPSSQNEDQVYICTISYDSFDSTIGYVEGCVGNDIMTIAGSMLHPKFVRLSDTSSYCSSNCTP